MQIVVRDKPLIARASQWIDLEKSSDLRIGALSSFFMNLIVGTAGHIDHGKTGSFGVDRDRC